MKKSKKFLNMQTNKIKLYHYLTGPFRRIFPGQTCETITNQLSEWYPDYIWIVKDDFHFGRPALIVEVTGPDVIDFTEQCRFQFDIREEILRLTIITNDVKFSITPSSPGSDDGYRPATNGRTESATKSTRFTECTFFELLDILNNIPLKNPLKVCTQEKYYKL